MSLVVILQTFVFAMAFLLMIPVGFFTLQCWLGLFGLRQGPLSANQHTPGPAADILVLIPAHNEMQVIANTLQSILPQLAATDRLLVVADNCQDQTVSVVKSMQQRVVIRNNTQQTGKGYALAYGLEAIRDAPPAILVIIDADCQILPNCIEQLRHQVMQTA
ncbi:MAG: glycosyltransferase, partial [Methylophaga sp.]|nr:glycosyltransferase [Methylophaga sp.]